MHSDICGCAGCRCCAAVVYMHTVVIPGCCAVVDSDSDHLVLQLGWLLLATAGTVLQLSTGDWW